MRYVDQAMEFASFGTAKICGRFTAEWAVQFLACKIVLPV